MKILWMLMLIWFAFWCGFNVVGITENIIVSKSVYAHLFLAIASAVLFVFSAAAIVFSAIYSKYGSHEDAG